MADSSRKVEFFGLTTCVWCKKTRAWLDENNIEYDCVYVDELSGDEREAAKERVLKFADKLAFPIVIIDDGASVIRGFNLENLQEALK